MRPLLCAFLMLLMPHPALARGGHCDEFCGSIVVGIAGIAVLIGLGVCIDGVWRYDKLKAKYPTMMPWPKYVAMLVLLLAAIAAFGFFYPGPFFGVVILTVLVAAGIGVLCWAATSGNRRRR